MGIFFDSLEQSLVIVDGFINIFLILDEVFLVYFPEVVQVSMNCLVRLLVLQFNIIEQFHVGSYFLIDFLEIGLKPLDPPSYRLGLRLFHKYYKFTSANQTNQSSCSSSKNYWSSFWTTPSNNYRSSLPRKGMICSNRLFTAFLKKCGDLVNRLTKISTRIWIGLFLSFSGFSFFFLWGTIPAYSLIKFFLISSKAIFKSSNISASSGYIRK